MTLQDINFIVGLYVIGVVPADLFQDRLNQAHIALLFQRWGEKDFESLRGFKRVIGDKTPPVYIKNGRGDIPADYFAFESAYHNYKGTRVKINFVDDFAYDTFLSHKIEYPTNDYPVGNIQSSYIRIQPETVRFVVFSYIVKPSKLVYAIKVLRGFPEFDAVNSSAVPWNDADCIVLIQNILQLFGINVTKSEIQQKINEK